MRLGERSSRFELRPCFNDEKKRANAHRPKVPTKEGFMVGLDIRDKAFEGKDDGNAAEKENEDEKGDEIQGG